MVLREAYELAARASIASSDFGAGLAWAQRSLRLLPENPSLLVMVADVAAKQRDTELAERSAHDALRYLSSAGPPAAMPPRQWRAPSAPAAPAMAVTARYAGSSACRDCHPRVYERWQTTGMAKMFRPYRTEDVVGDFSGAQTFFDSARRFASRTGISSRSAKASAATGCAIASTTSSARSGSRPMRRS